METKIITQKYSRKSSIKISIAGKDVSKDLAPYIKSFTYNDKSSDQVDDINITLDDRDGLFIDDWMPDRGDVINCSITVENWDKDGDKSELICGKFEIDEVSPKGPPSEVAIKAVSMLNAKIRRELHSKSWESVTFEKICLSIATENNMELSFEAEDISIDRIDQTEQSDLTFLAKLCEDYGCKIKINDDTLFIYSDEIYEAQDIALVINKFEVTSYLFKCQAHDIYKDCKVVYFDPSKKKTHKAVVGHKQSYIYNPEFNKQRNKKTKTGNSKKTYSTYTYNDQANIQGGGKTLILRARVSSPAEAERLAKAALRRKNKGEWVINLAMPGSTKVATGLVIELEDFGRFDGIYMIDEANHSDSQGNGYETAIEAHRVLGSWENLSDE